MAVILATWMLRLGGSSCEASAGKKIPETESHTIAGQGSAPQSLMSQLVDIL
jgi:hypothetical protein